MRKESGIFHTAEGPIFWAPLFWADAAILLNVVNNRHAANRQIAFIYQHLSRNPNKHVSLRGMRNSYSMVVRSFYRILIRNFQWTTSEPYRIVTPNSIPLSSPSR